MKTFWLFWRIVAIVVHVVVMLALLGIGLLFHSFSCVVGGVLAVAIFYLGYICNNDKWKYEDSGAIR